MKHILKKFSAALLSAAMIASSAVTASAASVTDFKDVNPNAWYYEAVDYAAQENLFNGTSKNTFSPGGAMTRGMFVTVLGRKAGVDISQYLTCRFTDVKQGDWYTPYVEWAATYGIVSGTSKTTFSPNQKVTREQMAAFLYRYATATGNDASYSEEAYSSFPDTDKVSDYAVEAMKWATTHGIINGSDGKLNPKGTATRAQVAKVFLGARDILTKTEMAIEPQLPVVTDSKAHPNNVYNVFAREFSADNDWQVSSKSKMDASEQAQLISLLQGKTGDMVWNDIALNGMTTGQVGATRNAQFMFDYGNDGKKPGTVKATSIEKVAETILNRLSNVPDAKYICVTLADAESDIEGVLKDYNYKLFFINTPEAVVSPSDSAFVAKVKRLTAERLPAGIVLSNSIAPAGGWSDFIFLPFDVDLSEDELAEQYADFFVYMLYGGGWGKYGYDEETGVGYWCYQIALAPNKDPETGNNGHPPLRAYYA